jgi:hypothetical protein
MKNAVTKVPVTKRALLQRVNRALAKQGQAVKTWRTFGRKGKLFLIDLNGPLLDANVDLVALAKRLGAIQEWEALSKD